MTKDEALRLALEALETSMYPQQKQLQAITAIKAALEAKDEPVAWVDERAIAWLAEHPNGNVTTKLELQKSFERPMPLYTNPTQRKPLTDEEIGEVAIKSQDGISPHDDTLRFARAIEAAHGIKGEE